MAIERRFTVDIDACREALRDSDSYVVDVDSMPTVDAAPGAGCDSCVQRDRYHRGGRQRHRRVRRRGPRRRVAPRPEVSEAAFLLLSLVTGSRHALDLFLLNSC